MIYGLDTGFIVAVEVVEHQQHHSARELIRSIIAQGNRFALTPQVLAEFIHVVTDSKRFASPLSVDQARDIAAKWWNASEVNQIFPNETATKRFLDWHKQFRLGRKRLLDTLLAATFMEAGVLFVCTTNPADFETFDVFTCIEP